MLILQKKITYGSLSLSFRFGNPIYSESSCIKILINIRLADEVSSSLSLIQVKTYKYKNDLHYNFILEQSDLLQVNWNIVFK